jgi:hypothetical protein
MGISLFSWLQCRSQRYWHYTYGGALAPAVSDELQIFATETQKAALNRVGVGARLR